MQSAIGVVRPYRLGAVAAAIGAAWIAFLAVFYVGANFVWTGESQIPAVVLAIALALATGVAVDLLETRPHGFGKHGPSAA